MGLFHRGRKNRKEETDESVKTNGNALQDSADGAEAEEKTESEKKGEVSLSAEELEKKAQQVNLGRMNRLELIDTIYALALENHSLRQEIGKLSCEGRDQQNPEAGTERSVTSGGFDVRGEDTEKGPAYRPEEDKDGGEGVSAGESADSLPKEEKAERAAFEKSAAGESQSGRRGGTDFGSAGVTDEDEFEDEFDDTARQDILAAIAGAEAAAAAKRDAAGFDAAKTRADAKKEADKTIAEASGKAEEILKNAGKQAAQKLSDADDESRERLLKADAEAKEKVSEAARELEEIHGQSEEAEKKLSLIRADIAKASAELEDRKNATNADAEMKLAAAEQKMREAEEKAKAADDLNAKAEKEYSDARERHEYAKKEFEAVRMKQKELEEREKSLTEKGAQESDLSVEEVFDEKLRELVDMAKKHPELKKKLGRRN